MLVDVCSFLPVEESYHARLLGWAAIPGYFRMFAKGLSHVCGMEEAGFRGRIENRSDSEILEFVEEIAARLGRPADDFVEEMDAAGYDVSVVFSIDQESTTGAPPLDHEVLARAVAAFPKRLLALAGVDPNKADAAEKKAEPFENLLFVFAV